MDRRRRRRSHHGGEHQQQSKPSSKGGFLGSLFNLVLFASLIAAVYYLMERHCATCSAKCEHSVAKNIDEIANNILLMKRNYADLESKVFKFSKELPKIEGQIEMLELLATSWDRGDLGWGQKGHLSMPHVKLFGPQELNAPNISVKKVARNVIGNIVKD